MTTVCVLVHVYEFPPMGLMGFFLVTIVVADLVTQPPFMSYSHSSAYVCISQITTCIQSFASGPICGGMKIKTRAKLFDAEVQRKDTHMLWVELSPLPPCPPSSNVRS